MDEAVIKRISPHSIEAEQSVIGSMIMDKDAIVTVSEILIAEDFYQNQYGVLFDAMVELFNEGKPVDLVTLQNRLKEKELPPELSSLEFIRDLVAAVPTSTNAKYYANIVKEKAILRKLIKVTEGIANECYLSLFQPHIAYTPISLAGASFQKALFFQCVYCAIYLGLEHVGTCGDLLNGHRHICCLVK